MNVMKKLIIFLLLVYLIVSYGCTHKPPSQNTISQIESHNEAQGEAQEDKSTRMSFLLPSGKESGVDLQKAIEICAGENGINLTSSDNVDPDLSVASALDALDALMNILWVITLPAQILSMDSLLLTGPPGSMGHYEAKVQPYRLMQRCMEQRGYICEGFCPDSRQESIERDNLLSECLNTSMDSEDCYEEEKERNKLKTELAVAPAPELFPPKECGDTQDIKRLFLAHNVWVSYKDQQYSVNYKEGKILPAGTEIINPTLHPVNSGSSISFTVKDTCETISVGFVPSWHSGKMIADYYNLMFTDKDFEEIFAGFQEEEIKAIIEGRLVLGMSKEAILVAYGYPPEAFTPDCVNSNIWTYWINPQKPQRIGFDNKGELIKIYQERLSQNNKEFPAELIQVIDGDTFLVRYDNGREGKFNLYAIDAPDQEEPFDDLYGGEARLFAIDFLRDKDESLIVVPTWNVVSGVINTGLWDVFPDDVNPPWDVTEGINTQPGLLQSVWGYVKVGDEILNQKMIENGYAKLDEPCSNVCDDYRALEREAKSKGVGMWRAN